MVRGRIDKSVARIGILIFLILIALGYLTGIKEFVLDSVIFIILILFFYFSYDKWNLSTPVFAFLILSFIPHNLGIFGFYFQSPLPIQWDHVTHFFPIMAFSMLFFRFLMPYMDKRFFSLKTLFLLLVALTAALGVGTFIENAEFLGFLVNGFGEGAFAFGAGDALPGQVATSVEEIEAFGGGWFNTMRDLIWNLAGALAGLLLIIAYYAHKPLQKNK